MCLKTSSQINSIIYYRSIFYTDKSNSFQAKLLNFKWIEIDETDETTVIVTMVATMATTMTATMTETTETTWAVDAIRNARIKASAIETGEEAPKRATADHRETMIAEAEGTSLKPTGEMTAVMIDEVTMDAGHQTTTLREVANPTSVSELTIKARVADTRSPRMALVITLREVALARGQSIVATVASVGVAGEEEVVETLGVVEVEEVTEEDASWEVEVAVVAGKS